MSDRPTEVLEWATVDIVDPITGVNNVVEPPQSLKNTGYAPAYIKPTRQYENWFKRAASKWIKYLDQKAGSNIMELQTSWWGSIYLESTSSVTSIAKNTSSSFFVIGGVGVYSGNGVIYTSSDTLKWTRKTTPFETYDFVYTVLNNPSNDNFLAAGANGKLAISTDNCNTWVSKTSQFGTDTINVLYYGNNIILAAGSNGKLSVSTDNGNTWVAKTSQFGTDTINGIFYNNGVFTIVGANGKLAISTDNGNTWVSKTSQFGTTNINAIYCYNNKWLAVGDSGKWSISTDNGNTWVAKTIFTDLNLTCITSKDNYLLMGSGGIKMPAFFSSNDSENWIIRSIVSFVVNTIPFVIYGKGSFICGNGPYVGLSIQLSE